MSGPAPGAGPDGAFYLPDGDRLVPTEWTRGPWEPGAQHAGPPAGLLGRALERLEPAGRRVGRITVEILRPIRLAPMRVEAAVARPGRRVDLAEATLSDPDGPVALARAWRVAEADEPVPEAALEPCPYPPPERCPAMPAYSPGWDPSYLAAMEWRTAAGAFLEPGPAAAWMRMRIPLVPGEEPSPLQRVLVAADSGNGISMTLPLGEYLFINTDLTVHLLRGPGGEWVCLDAITRIDPGGVGLAQSVLWDERGRIGTGAQTLLVARR